MLKYFVKFPENIWYTDLDMNISTCYSINYSFRMFSLSPEYDFLLP